MKKFICLILVLTLMLSGCKFVKGEDVTSSKETTNPLKYYIPKEDDWTPPNFKDQISSPSSEITSPTIPLVKGPLVLKEKYENGARAEFAITRANNVNDFINALMKNDVKTIRQMTGFTGIDENENSTVYDAFKDVKIDKIQVLSYTLDIDKCIFTANLKLTISKSSTDLFKVGESEWIIDASGGFYSIVDFYDTAKPKYLHYLELPELTSRAFAIAERYSSFNDFRTTTVFDKIVRKSNNRIDDYSLYIITSRGIKNSSNLYVDQYKQLLKGAVLREYIERVLGVKNYDLSISENFDKDKDILALVGGGGWNHINKLKSYNLDEKKQTLTLEVDFFADFIGLVVAKTMRYQFYVDSEENLKLVSMENIYNTDYEIMIISN